MRPISRAGVWLTVLRTFGAKPMAAWNPILRAEWPASICMRLSLWLGPQGNAQSVLTFGFVAHPSLSRNTWGSPLAWVPSGFITESSIVSCEPNPFHPRNKVSGTVCPIVRARVRVTSQGTVGFCLRAECRPALRPEHRVALS